MSEYNESKLVLGVFTPNKPILSTDPRLLVANGGWWLDHNGVQRTFRNPKYGWFSANGVKAKLIMPEDLENALVGEKATFEPLR